MLPQRTVGGAVLVGLLWCTCPSAGLGGEEGTGGREAAGRGTAEADRIQKVEEDVARLERENQALREELELLERRQFELSAEDLYREEPADGDEREAGGLAERSRALDARYGVGRGGTASNPVLSAERRAFLGGYLDLEYVNRQGENGSFVQHRFVPLIYADVTERLKVGAEVEFEYGGTDSAGGGGETKVEFATLDYAFVEEVTFRAGALLVPLGKFNLMHDSPINDLTDRPLVNRFIIPTTLTEAGLGFVGTLYPVEPFEVGEELEVDLEVTYEAYLVNGFRGLVADSSSPTGYRSIFNDTKGLRDGRSSLKVDNNGVPSGVARLGLSPFLGTELGVSVHAGPYDDLGDNLLVLYAVDGLLQLGRFVPELSGLELQGEFAYADISRDSLAISSGVPDDMWGYYGQVNYRFMFEWLQENLSVVFQPESTFTAVVRLGEVDLDTNRRQRVTLGLNFRPIAETVFKFDYQFNFEDWRHNTERNDAFLFSVATYF